ncbi:MAG TPA: hypothetical protein VED66_10205 [Candidatus Sulfotelmatobacter sp.]|nr:hypothetical protein [Candidatus Sulfotelmatobacter sp.]
MSQSELEEQHRSELRPHLEAILNCVKALHATVSAVMADNAAIRKTMFDDPENIDSYRNHLKQAMATTKPLVDEAMLSYDFLMQEIIDSQQWEN